MFFPLHTQNDAGGHYRGPQKMDLRSYAYPRHTLPMGARLRFMRSSFSTVEGSLVWEMLDTIDIPAMVWSVHNLIRCGQ